MDIETQLRTVKTLLAKGYGRRRIAKDLGVTEWAARGLMQIVVKDLLPLDSHKAKKTKKRIEHTKEVKKSSRKSKPTTTRIISSTEESDIPNKVTTRKADLKVAVLSDIHFPYEDSQALAITKAFLLDYQPDTIVWNGDVMDMYSVSKYEKSIHKKMNVQDELDYGYNKLDEWVNTFSDADHYYVEGNHESRFKRMVKRDVPALECMRSLNIEKNLELDRLGITWVPEHEDLYIGNLMFTHGTLVRKHAGNSARGHFEMYGCSVLIGHVHRLSVAYKRNKNGHHAMIENGTLCDFDVEYARFPDWQHGFTTLQFDGDDFSVTQHAINGYKLVGSNGIVYMA